MKNGQSKLTFEKIVNYCPKCPISRKPKKLGRNKSVLFRAVECKQHKPKFVKSDNGVMVSEEFVDNFNEMLKPLSLSSQEI